MQLLHVLHFVAHLHPLVTPTEANQAITTTAVSIVMRRKGELARARLQNIRQLEASGSLTLWLLMKAIVEVEDGGRVGVGCCCQAGRSIFTHMQVEVLPGAVGGQWLDEWSEIEAVHILWLATNEVLGHVDDLLLDLGEHGMGCSLCCTAGGLVPGVQLVLDPTREFLKIRINLH